MAYYASGQRTGSDSKSEGCSIRVDHVGSVSVHVGSCFTREEEKNTSAFDYHHVAKPTLPKQTQRGDPAPASAYMRNG